MSSGTTRNHIALIDRSAAPVLDGDGYLWASARIYPRNLFIERLLPVNARTDTPVSYPIMAQSLIDMQFTNYYLATHEDRLSRYRVKAQRFGLLGDILLEHYHCAGPVHLLAGVVELFASRAAFLSISAPQSLPAALARQADAQFARYQLKADLDALTRSTLLYNRALSLSGGTSPYNAYWRAALAHALVLRFEETGCEADCRAGLELVESIRHDISQTTINYQWILAIIGCIKTRRTMWSIKKPTIDELQKLLGDIQTTMGPSTVLPRSQSHMILLAQAFLHRDLFERTKLREHLDKGLNAARLAVDLCTPDAEVVNFQARNAVFGLHNVAYQYCRGSDDWHTHVQEALDIIEGLRGSSFAARNTSARARLLYLWTMVYWEECDQLDNLDGLERQIDVSREVVNLWPRSHISRPTMINNLVYVLVDYFTRSGRVSALDEAINLEAISDEYFTGSPFLAGSIAEAMILRAQVADGKTARLLLSRALKICQRRQNAPGFAAAYQVEHADISQLMIRASRIQAQMGDNPFLDSHAIIELSRQSLDNAGLAEASVRMGLAIGQSDALIAQARSGHDTFTLGEAIQMLEETLLHEDLKSSFHRVDLLAAQAEVMVAQSDLQGSGSLSHAWEKYRHAITITQEKARERFQACLRWASHAAARGCDDIAFEAYSHAIDILPLVVFRGEDIIGRVEALRQVSGLAASSAAVALTINDCASAVDFLEKTRGILWLQSFHGREYEIASLPSSMANKFNTVITELENADRVQWTVRRRKALELEQVTSEIRSLPGMDRFLLPPLLSDIEKTVQDEGAYAIVIVPTNSACDVVIIGGEDGRSHLRLPTVNIDHLRSLSQAFTRANSVTRDALHKTSSARKIFRMTEHIPTFADTTVILLADLWRSLVQPIIKHLLVKGMPRRESRKRVWWCPIAVLGSLPIHAAGVYDGTCPDHVGNYVISSYTPTLTALHRLLDEKRRPHVAPPMNPSILLVAQPEVANQPSLPHARVEADMVRSLLPRTFAARRIDSEGTSVSAALEQAESAHIIHLACHGHQDQDDPLQSGFDLKDGRLTLSQLMHVKTPHAQLAYLSACESAGMDENRPDEGLNLVGAMIFAGLKSVIGTLWAMDDMDGPFMAERIYSRIFRDGELDLRAVPYAIDDAVQELRESGVPAGRWATYVHFGA